MNDSNAEATVAGHPLAPHHLVHVGVHDNVLLPHTQAERSLDRRNASASVAIFPASAPDPFDPHRAGGSGPGLGVRRLPGAKRYRIAERVEAVPLPTLAEPGRLFPETAG